MPDTATEIVTDTLQFLPHRIPFPITTVDEHLKHAVDNIVTLLSTKLLTSTPTTQQHKQLQVRDAFRQVARVLNNDIPPPSTKYGGHEPRVNFIPFPSVPTLQHPPITQYGVFRPRVLPSMNQPAIHQQGISPPKVLRPLDQFFSNSYKKTATKFNHCTAKPIVQ